MHRTVVAVAGNFAAIADVLQIRAVQRFLEAPRSFLMDRSIVKGQGSGFMTAKVIPEVLSQLKEHLVPAADI